MSRDHLRSHWLSLWSRVGGNPASGHRPFERLADRYGEPHRHYHTLDHVRDCLCELDVDLGAAAPQDKDAVEMAIWFHDAVYDPKAKDNEAKSAELCRLVLDVGGIEDAFAEKVAAMVLATAHVDEPQDHDTKVLIDIDLSILGRPETEFDAYERAIRREYDWVPDDAFRTGRIAILERFAARAVIFATQPMRHAYEDAARRNLQRSLERLRQGVIIR